MRRYLPLLALLTLLGCGKDERAVKPILTDEQRAQAEKKNPPPQTVAPTAPKDSGALTGKTTDERPKSLIGNIRGRAARVERQNELKQIGLFYQQMMPPPATAEQLMNELKRDAKSIYDAMQDGYYVVNPRALKRTVPGEGIIAYEVEPDVEGRYVVLGSGSVVALPEDRFKEALAR